MVEPHLSSDRPADEDLLGRGPVVDRLARWVRSAPRAEGFVIGVTGPWGSGKTTVLGLLEKRLADDEATVLWFDPWLFSTADDLVVRFFDEVAGTLARAKSKSLKKVAKGMADFGAALSPAAAVLLGPAGQLTAAPKRLADLKQSSAAHQRRALRNALLHSGRQIVVLIDDIDRLETREIREIMRLVKLIADLPGVIHVLGYERSRVERAVAESGPKDGRAYLEKIVQASVSLPPVRAERLRKLSMDLLQDATRGYAFESWDNPVWSEMLVGGVDGFLQTMRHGHLLANLAPTALDLYAGEVAWMDVIALEAMRIFDPNVHEELHKLVDILVGSDDLLIASSTEEVAQRNQARLTEALERSSHPVATRHLLSTLFPATADLLGTSRRPRPSNVQVEKRVAARPVLMHYLYLDLPPDEAPSADVDTAVAALVSGPTLKSVLDRVDDERLADLLGRVRARVSEQPQPDAFGCSMVLLRVEPRVQSGGFLDASGADQVRWLVEDLVKTSQPSDARAELAAKLVAEAPTLSQRLDMLYAFKVRSEEGDRELALLPTEVYGRLAHHLALDVQAAAPEVLAAEKGVFWLLELMHEQLGAAAVLATCKSHAVLRAVLETPGTRVRPQTGDQRVSLHLKPLVAIAGEEVLDPLRLLAADGELEPRLEAALRTELDRGPTDV